jgi:hypothetical protein
VKIAGLTQQRLYEGVLRLSYVVHRERAWPHDVVPVAGAWMSTGFDLLWRLLFARQPPEGSVAAHVVTRIGVLRSHGSSPTSLGLFVDEDAPAWRALLCGEASFSDDSGDGGARASRLIEEARARLAQTSAAGPVWTPGQLSIGEPLQRGRLVVAPGDVEALWALAQRDRALRAAAIVQGYLFLLPHDALVTAVLQPSTWRGLPADALQRLTDVVVALAVLLDPAQRQALAALGVQQPALAARLAEHERTVRPRGPLERLIDAVDAAARHEVVAGVDLVTGGKPSLLLHPRPLLERRFVDDVVTGAVTALQKRWAKKPLHADDDLWEVETFRLAWLVLQAFVVQQWDRAGEGVVDKKSDSGAAARP